MTSRTLPSLATAALAPLLLAGCLAGRDAAPAATPPLPARTAVTAVAPTRVRAADIATAAATDAAVIGSGSATTEVPAPTPDPNVTPTLTAMPEIHGAVSGEQRQWHKVTLSFEGPMSLEDAAPRPFRAPNPFLDYRLDVAFTHEESGRTITVPGYYAADGDAGNTGADVGTVWRAHFAPDAEGVWSYRASFRTGPDVAVSDDPLAGEPTAFDGANGRVGILPTDKAGRDHRGKGLLQYAGTHYLRFAETGEHFIKGGANSPENLLGYYEFDNTRDHGGFGNDLPDGLHHFDAHARDWRPGDPTWAGGKGQRLIGALNYLAGQGMNSVYFLTMNVGGDGQEVYPWTGYDVRDRFDVSKLDQWEVVFAHMDRVGLMMHVVTQETENDQLLDEGGLGVTRRLYYRELIARFGHHLAVTWNLGEENSNSSGQRKDFARFIRTLDPYDHPITVHTFPSDRGTIYRGLLGFEAFEGPSLQMNEFKEVNTDTRRWREASVDAGRPWVVTADELGNPGVGAQPDATDPDRPRLRHEALWGNLMAGGGGVEWFFGIGYPHNDLDLEDWRTRANLWTHTRHALAFFQTYLPFTQMTPCNRQINNGEAFCFGLPGQVYAVYMRRRGPTELDLGEDGGSYSVRWYNPRTGGALQTGSVPSIQGPGAPSIGDPPGEHDRDWVALIRRSNS